MDILIIKLGAMGDVLRTTAILPGLKEKYKECKIDWVTRKNAFDIIKGNDKIDNVFVIDDLNELSEKYELVINLDEEKEACEIVSKVESERIIGGYLKEGERVYTDDSSEWFDMGLISRFGKTRADELKGENKRTYQDIIYDILELDKKQNKIELKLGDDGEEFAKSFAENNNLDGNGIVIGLNTGAGERWGLKKLGVNRTIELANKIDEKFDVKVILFGGSNEKKRNDDIIKGVNFDIIDAGCDNSLMEFGALVNLCDVVICSDSLILHIATALGKKIVVFFTVTSAAEIDLYGKGKKIVTGSDEYRCNYVKGMSEKVDSLDLIDVDEIIVKLEDILLK